jgi:hypothetical protein
MINNCYDVFSLICEKIDIDSARWFYCNWINNLSHFDFNNIIDDTIYEFLWEGEDNEDYVKHKKFIDYCIDAFYLKTEENISIDEYYEYIIDNII